jgi:hypothetical protein
MDRTLYSGFAAKLAGLESALYVYPFAQTHITVLTAVDFRHEFNPTPERVGIIDQAARRLAECIRSCCKEIAPFQIVIGPPVLSPRAAFLTIANPGGEIERLRQHAREFCIKSGPPLDQVQVPSIIHSTILRFRQVPRVPRFLDGFRKLVDEWTSQRGTVRSVLIARELRPYLSSGKAAAISNLTPG